MNNTYNSANNSANESKLKVFFRAYKKYIIRGLVIIGIIFLGGYSLYVYNYCRTTEVDNLAMQNACKINMASAMTQTKLSDKVLTREEKKLIEAMKIAVSRYKTLEGAFTFIQEQNLQVSAESYQQVRETMEIYYAKFYAKQESLNDMARVYKRKLRTFCFGGLASWFGFPSQEYTDARIDQMVLEEGVDSTYNSTDRTMPEIPIGADDTTK